MKNTRDIDYHERHKLQTYKLVVEWEEQAIDCASPITNSHEDGLSPKLKWIRVREYYSESRFALFKKKSIS